MNISSIDNYRTSQRIHPLSLLAQMSSRQSNGCLRVSDGSTSWWIYLNNGDLVHASHSVSPFKRLERHLRQMGNDIPSLGATVRGQVHQLFNTVPERDIDWLNPPDYLAIRWLVEKRHLTMAQAATLLEAMAKEVLEAFLQIREGVHELIDCSAFMSSSLLCLLELRPIVEACQQRLRERGVGRVSPSSYSSTSDGSRSSSRKNKRRQDSAAPPARRTSIPSFGSGSRSSDSREPDNTFRVEDASFGNPASMSSDFPPALPNNPSARSSSNVPPAPASRNPAPDLTKPPKFYSQPGSESMAQFGTPTPRPSNTSQKSSSQKSSSSKGTGRSSSSGSSHSKSSFGAKPPSSRSSGKPPVGRGPGLPTPRPSAYQESGEVESQRKPSTQGQPQVPVGYPASLGAPPKAASKIPGEKIYKVACIDDSPMILHMIEAFLEDKSFAVIKINDPVRALMELMRTKPDIILMDITMPNLDGYELCALLRSRPDFRNTPIVMVTGSKGLIDRAKARLVKASGYLTKPFNQTQLLKIIFKLLK